MNPEDLIRQFQQMNGGQSQPQGYNVPVEKIDEFIKRCQTELGYDEHSLHQSINYKLRGQSNNGSVIVCSFPEVEILPLVLQRLEGK